MLRICVPFDRIVSLELGFFMLGHVQTELPLAPAAEPAVLASVFLVMLHIFVPQHGRLRIEGTNLATSFKLRDVF